MTGAKVAISAEPVFRPAMVLMAGRFIGFAAAFVIPMVLARVFSQEEFGTYKQLFLIFGTLFGIAQVGMAESLYYFLPNERKHAGSYVMNTLMVLAGVGLVAVGGLWLFRDWVGALLNNPGSAEYLPYIGIYLMLMLLAVLLEIVMTVKKQHLAASSIYALSDMTRTLLYISPVLFFSNLHALMLGAIGFAAIRCAAMLIYVLREFGVTLRPNRPLLKRHLAYAIPFGMAGVIEIVQLNYHLYAVSYYFDVATFAIYAVGCLQLPLTDFLATSTSNVVMTSMREKLLNGDKQAAMEIWKDAMRKLSLVLCPLVVALMLVANELIILLFTDLYAASVPVFIIWTLGTLFALLISDGVLRVLAETRFLILQNLIQLLLIAATIPWFIAHFGVIGAVLVTLVSTAICKALAIWRIKVVFEVGFARLLPWRSLAQCFLIAALAAVPALVVKWFVVMPLLPLLMLLGTVYCLVYFALLLRCGPMDGEEKTMLLHWVGSPFVWACKALKSN